MVKNHLVTPIEKVQRWEQKSNSYNSYIFGKKMLLRLILNSELGSRNGHIVRYFQMNILGQSHFTLLLEAARGIVINNNSQKIVKIQLNIKCLRQLQSQNLLQYDEELVINKEKDDQKSKKDFLISCIRNAIKDHSLQINMQTWTEMRSLLFPNPVTDALTVYTSMKNFVAQTKNLQQHVLPVTYDEVFLNKTNSNVSYQCLEGFTW